MRKAQTTQKVQWASPLTHKQVKEMLDYDHETGLLTWKIERYRKHPGDVAGCVYTVQGKNNYKRVSISINYKRYLAHRIIWFWVTGSWPEEEIDHIDNDATNNCWKNLRLASRTNNARNISLKKNNTSGVAGVSFSQRRQKFVAKITVDRNEKYLGSFNSLEEARKARDVAKKKYFKEFAGA